MNSVQGTPTSYVARSRRYVLAASGPISVSAANFLLSYSMLRLTSPHSFGTFAMLFTAAMLTGSMAAAMFGAPLQALHQAREPVAPSRVNAIVSAAVLAAALAFPAFVILGRVLAIGRIEAICYGLFTMLTVLRYVGRAWSYSAERPWHVAASDVSYAVLCLATMAVAITLGELAPARAVYIALAVGAVAAIASLGWSYAALLCKVRLAALHDYAEIWRGKSRWSLLSVVATEAGANAHIYLLTALVGAAGVAPIAASALLVRPINVIQGALVEFERTQLARYMSARDVGEIDRSLALLRIVLLLVWAGAVALGAAILAYWPSIVFPEDYDLATVRLTAILWAAVSLAIVAQMPGNVLLQAAGNFRVLSRAGLWASAINVAGVLLAIALDQPAWTVAALVPGWLVGTAIIQRVVRRFRRDRYRTQAGAT